MSVGADVSALAASIRSGDRRALARAITIVESTRPDHRRQADALLAELRADAGNAVRVGISGPPGAGKSTFIEAFGLYLLSLGRKPAVLAVDPSSPVSGGSILGDKTRMELLARDARAFIRPSPSGGTLGGVARRTREASFVCEAAGFDTILIETVGVGQSETAVAEMVDLFMLLLPPAGGDELQGIKKGIVELADLVTINKADGDLAAAAGRTASDYTAALHMLRPSKALWHPPVIQISALEKRGMDKVWKAIEDHRRALGTAGIAARRATQAKATLWREIADLVRETLAGDPQLAVLVETLEVEVTQGLVSPYAAAGRVVAALRDAGG
ncbi:MAG: methylmalonyl Co-A mutase-associated GTPase MeaB [Alphaproteobacteria bacterium]|nr:methylmalonyl Co-A mutase-associated GTPase MeaB [Alphaproteobacteria bacterium]